GASALLITASTSPFVFSERHTATRCSSYRTIATASSEDSASRNLIVAASVIIVSSRFSSQASDHPERIVGAVECPEYPSGSEALYANRARWNDRDAVRR